MGDLNMTSKTKELRLPSSRVKTIMKSSPEVENVSQDSLAVVTKATELFIQDLARQALKRGKPNKLDYSDVADVVQSVESLFFLKEIIPKKITVREYKDLMKKEGISDEISSDDSDLEVVEDESSGEDDDEGESGSGSSDEDDNEDEEGEEDDNNDDDDDDVVEVEDGEEVQR